MALKPIEILINAKDNASGVFSSLQAKVASVGLAIGAYFGIKSFVGIIEGAAQFEQALSKVQAATGASAAEMAKLKQAAQDAGANTKFTSTEAADALTNLGKAGLSAADAINTLPAVLNLAQAGGVELGAASEYITKAVAGMGLAFSDAARVADVLALGANATNTSVEGLAQALSYVAPVAQASGLSLESTTAILGKLADAGIDASRSGTGLSNMLSQFKDPASTFKIALADAGITTNNFETALKQLAVAGPKGEKAILAVGLNAGPALRALLNQGMGALDELKVKLNNAAGSAAATAKIMQDNLAGSFKGLSSAWDTVKNVLGTPVLPVLKDGVDQLAGAFRSAVADGTIQKFGDAIATGFQAGIKWVREFIGTVDFAAVTARLQGFADSANEAFAKIGEYATNAGATVKIAVGGVQTAFATLMVTAGGVANAIVLMAQAGITSMEMLYRASEKVTFGKLREQYKAIADDFKLQAEAMGAASDAVSAQIRTSLDGIGTGLGNVQTGFNEVKTAITGAAGAAKEGGAAQAALNKELTAGAEAAAAVGVAYQKKTQADQAAKQAADEHRAAIAKLNAEYAAAIASGNLQLAAELQEKLNQKLREAAPAAKDAEEAAKLVAAAFTRMGIVSSQALIDQAANSKRDYEIIKNAGTSTAEDLSNAFKKAADDAIAANKGVAPSWVEAQAATRGYKIEVDAAGKSTLVLADAVERSAGSMRGASGVARSHAAAMREVGDSYSDAGAKAFAAQGQFLAAAAAQKSANTSKSSLTNSKPSENQYAWTRATIIDYLKEAGLEDKFAEELSKQFTKADGSVDYTATDAQKKWGGKYSTLPEALGKMVDYYKHNEKGKSEAANRQEFLNGAAGAGNRASSSAANKPSKAAAQTSGQATSSSAQSGGVFISNITIPGFGAAALGFSDAQSQAHGEEFIRQLAIARSTAAIR